MLRTELLPLGFDDYNLDKRSCDLPLTLACGVTAHPEGQKFRFHHTPNR
jgi:hypothetical protein